MLKITSEQRKAGQVYTVTYNVADLVMPIPNFTGGSNLGVEGAYREAMGIAGGGDLPGSGGVMSTPLAVANDRGSRSGSSTLNPAVLGQMAGSVGTRRRRCSGRRTERIWPGRFGRRLPARVRCSGKLDYQNNPTGNLGRGRRQGHDGPVRDQPQPGRQPDAGSA